MYFPQGNLPFAFVHLCVSPTLTQVQLNFFGAHHKAARQQTGTTSPSEKNIFQLHSHITFISGPLNQIQSNQLRRNAQSQLDNYQTENAKLDSNNSIFKTLFDGKDQANSSK